VHDRLRFCTTCLSAWKAVCFGLCIYPSIIGIIYHFDAAAYGKENGIKQIQCGHENKEEILGRLLLGLYLGEEIHAFTLREI